MMVSVEISYYPLADDFNAPIRERLMDYSANKPLLEKIARQGAEKARESSAQTLKEVREIIGFKG